MGEPRCGRGLSDGYAAGLAALDAVADDPRLARVVPSIRADMLRRAG